jgi:hypothetical protein
MRSLLCIIAIAATLSVAPCGIASAETATSLPSPPPWLNPFCAVRADVAPWNGGYRVQLVSERPGAAVSAHVTLVGDTGIFDARIRDASLTGPPYEQRSVPVLVTLPQPAAIEYAYVASYYVDDAPQRVCQAEPDRVAVTAAGLEPPAAGKIVAAIFVKPLPALPCGAIYTPARVVKASKPDGFVVASVPVEDYRFRNLPTEDLTRDLDVRTERSSEVQVYIDDRGVPLNTYLVAASDKTTVTASLTAAQETTYAPATFLCTPTVGEYLFKLDMGAK